MPRPDHAWFHVMWHTYGTWLPGDPRGFRDRDHRIHSSGDYRNPPPPGEHAGLLRYARRVTRDEVVLRTPTMRREVCEALLAVIQEESWRVFAITTCRVHVHMVIELPIDKELFDKALTRIKTYASARVVNKPASRLWARRWKSVPIEDVTHRSNALHYVRNCQGSSVCAWTYREGFVRFG